MKLSRQIISIVVAVVCLITIPIFLILDIIRFTDVSSAMAYVLVGGVVAALIWGFRPHKMEESSTYSDKKESRLKNHQKLQDEPKLQQTRILHKNFKLRTDEYEDEKLNLKRGTKITGKISSDGFFHVYFLTESSYRSFKNDYNFQYLEGAEDVSHFEFNFESSRQGNYYFVIENADKKSIVVNVELYGN